MADSVDFLEAHLAMAKAALETARRLQIAAEEQRNLAVDQLRAIAASLLSTEWNAFLRDHPDAVYWPPEQLGAWIIDTGMRKLNRLQLLGPGDPGILEALTRERDALRAEVERLRREVERLNEAHRDALSRRQLLEEENQRLHQEIDRLNRSIAALSAPVSSPAADARQAPDGPDAPASGGGPAEWRAFADFRDVAVLRVLGQYGYVLRESVARAALGLNARTGGAVRLFERLREAGLIEERPAPSPGVRGKTPNLIALTDKGREVFRSLFGQEPVEPEDRRLLRRHRSPEQMMLALQARLILEEHGAEFVDLFPAPQALPDGGTFDVDLVAALDGRKLFVELEMAPRVFRRTDKWNRYARLTRDFYFFVPNRRALGHLVAELSYWVCDAPSFAAGVVLHICQISRGDDTLWHIVRPLGRVPERRP